ncbi:CD3337/EF1877 family mobilome membrane protein [Bacillus changyiensis]|uniref:CD3337/EF1877 family mobilome membrane protein n=1 Tax=Bacillus changyiensis TaxID=3004103 RepID=UPI0022E0DDFF|nr:hypothetical protein [Bacillus changyiensis]MDA1478031.1 hypothetical protein [Bacillus changyiensis]
MKRKKILIGTVVVLLFLTFFTAISVFSADGDTTTQPKSVKAGGVELEVKRFPISRYQANNESSDDWLKGPFIGFTNVIFSTSGNIVRVVDAGMDVLNNLQPVDKFADSITNVSKTVYKTLKNNFGETLFIFAAVYIFYLLIAKGSVKEAVRRSVFFIAVLVIGGWYVSNAGFVMKSLNSLSVEAQGKLLDAGNGLLGIAQDEKRYDTSNIEKGKEMEGTIAVLRNLYFDLALKKPYMIVNFGETNEKSINEKGSDDKGGLNRVDKLLSYKLTSDGEDEKLEYIKDTEIREYNNDALTSGNVWNQFGESLIAFFFSIGLGIPFLGLAFLNFLLQIIALLIVFFIPFAFVVAYVPQFANSGFVALGRLGSIYLLKAMLGIIFLFVYVICFVVDTLLPPNNFGMYLLNVIVLVLIFWMGFKYKDKIIKFVTAGKVVSVDNGLMENMRKDIVQPSWESTKSGVSNTFSKVKKSLSGKNDEEGEKINHSSDPSISRLGTGWGTENLAERTPQKHQNSNTLNDKKALNRQPQNLSKKQENNDEKVTDKNPSSNIDSTKENNNSRHSPVLQDIKSETDQPDQKEFSERNQLNDSKNRVEDQNNTAVAVQKEQEGDQVRKAPIVEDNIKETERTNRVVTGDHKGLSEHSQPAKSEQPKYLQTTNKQNNSSSDVKIVRPVTSSSSVQADNFFDGEKPNTQSKETQFVNRDTTKKVASNNDSLKRSHQITVNQEGNVSLNEIMGRSSSKGEGRLRRDERA